ncbi:MAG: patatin-like phospholipase family protein [Planctomycetes bacterium]|nr:patatin-like phospholipase family protein [Planctomycetota bacterium]
MPPAPKEKLALVFSGGGAKGAFGVGVLWELSRRRPSLRWDIVCGTSTGALIAPFAALGADDPGAIGELRSVYLNARKRRIVDSNLGVRGILGLFRGLPDGVYNLGPLRELIDRHLGPDRLRRLADSPVATVVNAVSLQQGEVVLCTQDRHRPTIEAWFRERAASASIPRHRVLPFSRFRKAMVASASIPGAIEPAELDGEQLVDGGVVDVAPLRSAIAAGATHILAVLMSPRRPPPNPARAENPLEVALRATDLLTDEILRNDIEYAGHVSDLRALAASLIAEESALPPGTATCVRSIRPLLDRLVRKTSVELAVLEPPLPLGETLDFDSEVARGWPESDLPGRKVNVMEARFEAGVREAAAALGKEEIPALIAPFGGGSP